MYKLIIGCSALFVLLTISSESFDVLYSNLFGPVGVSKSGLPFVYHVYISTPPIEPGDPTSYVRWSPRALALDAATFAAIAVLSVILTRRSSPPSRPDALIPATGGSSERLLRLGSGSCLLLTIVGSVVGLGLIAGPLGWWWSRRLRRDHEAHARTGEWAAAAAWTTGRAMTATMLACVLGLATR